MHTLAKSSRFHRTFKDYRHNPKVIEALSEVIELLLAGKPLSKEYFDHPLKGGWIGYRELHLFPNVLLVYERDEELRIITFVAIGSHSDLFH